MNRSARVILVVTVAALLSAPARAQAPRSSAEEARRHFEDGSKHYHLGEFTQAAEEYKAAYKARPDPVFLYNIAQAYRLANDFQQALFFYRSYLTSQPDTPNRAEIEERIHKLETQVAQQRALSTAPPTDAVAPGNQPKGSTAPGEAKPEATSLTSTPADATVVAQADSGPRRTPIYKKWWLWTIVGVAVAGAVVGVSVGVATHPTTTGSPSSHFGTVSF
jgi:tetratricopeptide (TPR) repeat protein